MGAGVEGQRQLHDVLEIARQHRLALAVRQPIRVQRDGIGGVDPARLERSIDQTAEGFKFLKRPSAADIFDESFLPPLGGRLMN